MARKPLADLRLQREWSIPEFARILGCAASTVRARMSVADDRGEGVIRLPVGDVPYIVDQFAASGRRLVLACDYEAVERARTSSAGQPPAASPSPGLAGNPIPDPAGTRDSTEPQAAEVGASTWGSQKEGPSDG